MTLLHSEFERLEKQLKMQERLFIASILMILLTGFLCYNLGVRNQEKETVSRAIKVIKENNGSYDAEDISFIAIGIPKN